MIIAQCERTRQGSVLTQVSPPDDKLGTDRRHICGLRWDRWKRYICGSLIFRLILKSNMTEFQSGCRGTLVW